MHHSDTHPIKLAKYVIVCYTEDDNKRMCVMQYKEREYQTRIVNKVLKLYNKHNNIMIESPTGSGKTVMGMKILEALGKKIVWVTMRRNLLAQAEKSMNDLGIKLDIHFDTIFGKSYPNADILVVDEAQHDATSSMNFVYQQVKPKLVLGMTATPFRTDKLTLCFEKIVRDIGIQQLIRLGYLAKFEHYNIPNWNPTTVATHYLMDPIGYGQSVMFFHKYEQCQEAYTILRKGKIRCDIVTANTDRESQLAKFENGELDVLINMMVLTEGFDYPNLKTVFIRDSVKLPTIQMGGRVLRISDDNAVKKIVQSNQTHYSFLRIATPICSYHWDNGQWMSLVMNENIDKIAMSTASAMVKIQSPDIPKKQSKITLKSIR